MLTIAGMGPGHLALMTPRALEAVAQADVLVGGKRHLGAIPAFSGEVRALDSDIPALLAPAGATDGATGGGAGLRRSVVLRHRHPAGRALWH